MNSQIELWKNTFEYVDGKLVWKVNIGTRARVGKIAGTLHKDGYWRVILNRKSFLVHRIIFALHNGYLPEIVDHIDRNPKNNKISNLRSANNNLNAHNSSISSSNKSGVKGIRVTKSGKYEARVAKDNKTYQVGTFVNLEDAKTALKHFRENLHGEFHCHG